MEKSPFCTSRGSVEEIAGDVVTFVFFGWVSSCCSVPIIIKVDWFFTNLQKKEAKGGKLRGDCMYYWTWMYTMVCGLRVFLVIKCYWKFKWLLSLRFDPHYHPRNVKLYVQQRHTHQTVYIKGDPAKPMSAGIGFVTCKLHSYTNHKTWDKQIGCHDKTVCTTETHTPNGLYQRWPC